MKIFTRYYWRNKWYKTKQFLNIAPEPSSASKNDVMTLLGDLLGESDSRTNIEELEDSVGALSDSIMRLPDEDSPQWRFRMGRQTKNIQQKLNKIVEDYDLS